MKYSRIVAGAAQAALVALMWSGCSGPSTTGDGGPDVVTKETSFVDKSVPDVGNQDVNTACGPNMIDPTAIIWAKPRPINAMGCNSQEIQDFLNICINGTSTSACTAWQTAHMTCNTCLNSNEGDQSFGPLINTASSGYIFVNDGGCIALLTGDTSDTGCGAAQWKTSDCEDDACAMCMDAMSYSACQGNADTSTCTQYYNAGHIDSSGNAAGTACANIDAGAIAACGLTASTFDAFYTAVATVMCGGYTPPPSDAGSDAPADAPSDGG
jgi:hypothetical protein